MATNNPAFSRNPAFNGSDTKTLTAEELNAMYAQPSATQHPQATQAPQAAPYLQPAAPSEFSNAADPMTYEDTIAKTAGLFAVVVLLAVVGWQFASYPVMIISALGAFGVGMVASFRKKPSVPLYFLYAALEGVVVGSISHIYSAQSDGIVTQAVIGTFSVVAVTLVLFRSGKVRTSPKLTKIVMVAMLGYFVFSLVNFALVAFNVLEGYGMRGGIVGILIGVAVVLMAAYCLVMDFEFIKNGVDARAPREFGWTGAFGLMVTIIWLYLEILRLIAIFRE